jgi:serine/threonine protein kinase/tetratricopeptide (TPR) repeat protein
MASDETIFGEALLIANDEAREAYLAKVCGDDAGLRSQVESLLLAHGRAGEFLEPPARADGVGAPAQTIGLRAFGDVPPRGARPAAESVGTVVGPYKLLERLGEGGMGVVYMAEQLRPVRRRVAMKIIKPGMDSKQVIARFEAERQALALMDHPGIARVLDAGATDTGRPFFAMELVRGVPITAYCDEHQLNPGERLRLFVQVCQAVQHAHQKGVIHRDLKPTNVLVTAHDGVAAPKVIDFGIAKATAGQPLTDMTLVTLVSDFMGTPLYMSPEQAELSGLDVDTRSDVYSLGVLLYELLTGTTPFDKQRLVKAGLDEMRRIIREEEPPRPSTRIGTLAADGAGSVSAQRGSDPRRLSRTVRGELDWIVMRCLEKDRTRRYETANALVRDVQRYLANEPIEACPPSTAYRLRKLVRRHRGAMVAASLLLVTLVGGIIGTTWGFVRAERRLAQNERNNALLASILEGIDPNPDKRRAASLRVALGRQLEQGASQLEGDSVADAVAAATLQDTLGCTLRNLGYPEKAIVPLRSAHATLTAELGPEDDRTIRVANDLAVSYLHASRPELAVPLLESVAQFHRQRLGEAHEDVLIHMGNLGDAYALAGRLDEAVPLLERTLEAQRSARGLDDLHTLAVAMNLARAYRKQDRYAESISLGKEALRQHLQRHGPDHRQTIVCRSRLADAYLASKDHGKAVQLYDEALIALSNLLGPDAPETFLAMTQLARACLELDDRKSQAVPLLKSALAGQRRELGEEHPETVRTMAKLGAALCRSGAAAEAVGVLQDALQLTILMRGADHADTLVGQHNLACAYRDAGMSSKAIAQFKKALAGHEKHLGGHHPFTLDCRANFVQAYRAAGHADEATPLIEQLVASYEAIGNDAEATKWKKELPEPQTAASSGAPDVAPH